MGRILGIDYGGKRSGLAVTDPLQIIVQPLTGLNTVDLKPYLLDYCRAESVDKIVLGLPTHADGSETSLVKSIREFKKWVEKKLELPVEWHEESFSSRRAAELIAQSGAKRKKRRDKHLLNKMSAVVILQEYLQHI